MSQMLTNIKRVVEEEISNRITMINVINEAIINALQANATRIICKLTADQDTLRTEEGEIVPRKVNQIEVEDNGEGFTELNYKSFGQYRSDYNAKLGCKGVGRFLFLKIFDTVHYTSCLAASKKKKEFDFSFDFDTDALRASDADISENKTVLHMSGVTPRYFNKEKHVDRRLDLNLGEIRERVLSHLLPALFLSKRDGNAVRIEFCDTGNGASICISDEDIPDFDQKEFFIEDGNRERHQFVLYYAISEGSKLLKAFYCAHRRTVCEFSDNDFRISLPDTCICYFLLESKYLDERLNDERNEFTIWPNRTDDLFSGLSWEMINKELKGVVSSLMKASIPNAVQLNKANLADIQRERPYLVDYIDPEDLEVAGFVDKAQIIRKAKKRFDDAKEKLLSHAGKSEYTDQDLQDAIQITQNELVVYVTDRVLVIDRLKAMLRNREQSEAIIHDLFMQKHTDDDYFCTGKNNLWLLDDRFTSYSYAASEKRIKEILHKIKQEDGTDFDDDRPDLALFFSHDPANKSALKSVLIELKSFRSGDKFDRDKYAGIQQLLDYIQAFKKKEDIKEIWAFLVTDIDPKFEGRLKTNGYTPMFSTDRPIYYMYYKEPNAFIYVFGVQTLISDAEARNSVFIDIINKNSRLNRLLSTQSTTAEDQSHGAPS